MKNVTRSLFIVLGIITADFIHAQDTATLTPSGSDLTATNIDWTTAADWQVALQAIEQVPPLPAAEATNGNTFWSAQHAPGTASPWPPLPMNPGLEIWPLGDDGVYLLDDLDYSWGAQTTTKANSTTTETVMAADGGPPSPPGGGSTNDYNPGGIFQELAPIGGTNLYIAQVSQSGGMYSGILSNTVADVQYEIQYTTDLESTNGWQSADPNWFFYGSEATNWTAFSVPMISPTNLFLRALSWQDSYDIGIPDWWQLEYFGYIGIDPYADPAGDGYSNLYKYQHGLNPFTFYAPQLPNVGVSPTLNDNGITISWDPAQGAVVSYTIYRNGSALTTVPATQLSYTDYSESVNLADPNDSDFPTYQIAVNYAGASYSAYSEDPPLNPKYTIATEIVRGRGGQPVLLVPNIPNGVTTIRVYVQAQGIDYPDPTLEGNSYVQPVNLFNPALSSNYFDIPVSSFTNSQYVLPASLLPPYGGYTISCRALGSDGTCGSDSATVLNNQIFDAEAIGSCFVPFVDGTEQLKENLAFALEAADEANSFQFAVAVNEEPQPPFWIFPTNYVSAGFYFPFDYGLPEYNYAFLVPFKPFEDNYFQRNFVYASTNLNSDGSLTSGVYYDSSQPVPIQVSDQPLFSFPEYNYVVSGNTNLLAPQMSATANQWIYSAYEPGSPGQGNIGISEVGTNLSLNSSQYNIFGLQYQTDYRLYSNGVSLLQNTLTAGGSSIPNVSYPEYFYGQVTPPQLQNIGYFFGVPFQDYLPGMAGFSPTNTGPAYPQVLAVGEPMLMTAWAKERITNSTSGAIGFLEQYFDKAYLANANGNLDTNQPTGILSEYGEFFATDPGKTFLMTKPDANGQQGQLPVYTIALATDVNHDGVIDPSFGSPDFTSPAHPFRFWVNNGNDGTGIGKDLDPEGQTSLENYSYGQIRSQRNLENFFRLWICGLPQLPASQGYTVTLSMTPVSGNPAINLYPAYESDGGTKYLTDTNVAALQLSTVYVMGTPVIAYGTALGTISSTQSYTLPVDGYGNAVFTHFLFEGAGIGEGQLTMTISQNGNTIAQTSTWLDIHDIKDFYDRGVVTNIISGPSSSWSSAIETEQYASASALGSDTNLIVLVHGFFVGNWDWLDEGDTVFKRLYWAGFKGHFATVKWPCQTGDPLLFDLSELDAYKASTGLTTYMNQLRSRFPGYRLNILAHSQGNAVVSEAIRNQGLQFDTYILTQGAVPASSYNVNAPTNTTLLNAEYGHPTPDWQPMGYHGVYTNLTGNVVNFFNSQDWALNKWVANQFLKPDADYGSDGTNVWEYVTGAPNMPITDSEVSRAFVARSRSWAIGAQAPASGQTSEGVISSTVDLQAQFGFGNVLAEHSAEWTRPIQTSRPYYQQVLRSCLIQPAP